LEINGQYRVLHVQWRWELGIDNHDTKDKRHYIAEIIFESATRHNSRDEEGYEQEKNGR
jgi:hypothetical protein